VIAFTFESFMDSGGLVILQTNINCFTLISFPLQSDNQCQ